MTEQHKQKIRDAIALKKAGAGSAEAQPAAANSSKRTRKAKTLPKVMSAAG
jgi:hypothetical protein